MCYERHRLKLRYFRRVCTFDADILMVFHGNIEDLLVEFFFVVILEERFLGSFQCNRDNAECRCWQLLF